MPKATKTKINKPRVSDELKERLIDLVRLTPCLWDSKDPLFKSKQPADAWRKISLDLGIDAEATWKNLRKSYTTYRNAREVEERSGAAGGQRAQWIFWDKMSFMKDHIEVRNARNPVLRTYEVAEPRPGPSGLNRNPEDSLASGENDPVEEDQDMDDSDEEEGFAAVAHTPTTSKGSNKNAAKSPKTPFAATDIVMAMKEAVRDIKPPIPPQEARGPSDGVDLLPKEIRSTVVVLGQMMHQYKLQKDADFLTSFLLEANKRIISFVEARAPDVKIDESINENNNRFANDMAEVEETLDHNFN